MYYGKKLSIVIVRRDGRGKRMMELIFNTSTTEQRGAIKENGKTVELFIEKLGEGQVVGNIYKGRVIDVLPGMDAAFIDIGRKRNGFLHKSELISYQKATREKQTNQNIASFIQEGQEIIVQVTKEEFGTKGVRLTEHISLPGKYAVYMPDSGYIGISKRMTSEAVREKWREKVKHLLKEEEGLILRTSAETVPEHVVAEDIDYLRKDWKNILKRAKHKKTPSVIYENKGMIERLLHDYSIDDIDRIVVDNVTDVQFLKRLFRFEEKDVKKIEWYQGKENIFHREQVEKELEKALQPKVWLKNGGFLFIEKTEALTVIDVNTGKFTGKDDVAETILKTNLEAAKEIAYQLRLRNISGIILIDFIAMKRSDHQKQVVAYLEKELAKDRSRATLKEMSSLGLVEVTRKKVRKSLAETYLTPCMTCGGTGEVLSVEALMYKLERLIHEYREVDDEALVFHIPKRLFHWLHEERQDMLDKWKERYAFTLFFQPNDDVETIHLRYMGTLETAKKWAETRH